MDEKKLRALAAEIGAQNESIRSQLEALRQDDEFMQQHVLPLVRGTHELAGELRGDTAFSVVREMIEKMGADTRQLISRRDLWVMATMATGGPGRGAASLHGEGTLGAGGLVLPAMALRGEGTVRASADIATVIETERVAELTDRGRGEDRLSVQRRGHAVPNAGLLLVLVLVWVIAVAIPAAEMALPPEAQTLVNREIGTMSLALAITAVILAQRRR